MILILLGTQDSPFPRLMDQVEKAVQKLQLEDEVFAQVGVTDYASERMHISKYFTPEEYERLFNEADLIIAHGGAGTLFQAMHLQKKVIAMARLAEFGEHNDDHQVELVSKLAKGGYILDAHADVTRAIRKAQNFTPKPYDFSNQIVGAVEKYIDEL